LVNEKIGFIGTGNMGEALLRGIINSGLVAPELIYASDINKEKLGILSKELNINIANNNKELIDNSDIILIAVKPDIVKSVLSEISGIFHQPKWFISIAAGINTSFIESILPDGISVVRVMPNTPAMVCEGMTAICPGKYANDDHINKAKQLFQAVGKTVIVNEKLMDAVTALSGSGPAFIFLLIETLADAGVQLGLSRNDALLMSTQTVLGSSKMLLETQEHPAVLKNRVTSPGGTTAVGLFELENNGFRSAIIKAIVSSAERSKELSTQSK
jgi:pyrroline-5-carboxylate reductase